MKLKNRHIGDLFVALRALGEVKSDINSDTRVLLARNMRLAREALADFETAQDQIRESHAESPKELTLHIKQLNQNLVEVPLTKIKISDLNLTKNTGISVTILEGLFHIIEEE